MYQKIERYINIADAKNLLNLCPNNLCRRMTTNKRNRTIVPGIVVSTAIGMAKNGVAMVAG